MCLGIEKDITAPRSKFDVLNLCILLQEVLILLHGKSLWIPLKNPNSIMYILDIMAL